jgi:hypothetical protein
MYIKQYHSRGLHTLIKVKKKKKKKRKIMLLKYNKNIKI